MTEMPKVTRALLERTKIAEGRLATIRSIHYSQTDTEGVADESRPICSECRGPYDNDVAWPCRTYLIAIGEKR